MRFAGSSERPWWRHRARNVAAVALAAIGVVAFGRSGAGGPPTEDQAGSRPSTSDHWQVIAQGIADLGGGPHQWTALPIAVGP